jgi:hypothetical protein
MLLYVHRSQNSGGVIEGTDQTDVLENTAIRSMSK